MLNHLFTCWRRQSSYLAVYTSGLIKQAIHSCYLLSWSDLMILHNLASQSIQVQRVFLHLNHPNHRLKKLSSYFSQCHSRFESPAKYVSLGLHKDHCFRCFLTLEQIQKRKKVRAVFMVKPKVHIINLFCFEEANSAIHFKELFNLRRHFYLHLQIYDKSGDLLNSGIHCLRFLKTNRIVLIQIVKWCLTIIHY